MNKIREIFKDFVPVYFERFGSAIPSEHRKAINAILTCRTGAHGLLYYECKKCGELYVAFRSCGNRHCPACQNHNRIDVTFGHEQFLWLNLLSHSLARQA